MGFESTFVPEPELMGFFNINKILRAILKTPDLVTKIHLGRTWPIHLLDLMCPQDDMDSGDSLDLELTKVTDEGNGNLMVVNASDRDPKQSCGEGKAGDQPDLHANQTHQSQFVKEMYTKKEQMVKWTVDNKMEDAKAELLIKLGGKRMRERSTSARWKRAKLTLVKRIYFDPAHPSKKPVYPKFLTHD